MGTACLGPEARGAQGFQFKRLFACDRPWQVSAQVGVHRRRCSWTSRGALLDDASLLTVRTIGHNLLMTAETDGVGNELLASLGWLDVFPAYAGVERAGAYLAIPRGDPGVQFFVGRNGSGKSRAARALSNVAGGGDI